MFYHAPPAEEMRVEQPKTPAIRYHANGLLVSDAEAEELSATRWDSSPSQKADRLRQAHNVKIGMGLPIFGFLLQGIALWLYVAPR